MGMERQGTVMTNWKAGLLKLTMIADGARLITDEGFRLDITEISVLVDITWSLELLVAECGGFLMERP